MFVADGKGWAPKRSAQNYIRSLLGGRISRLCRRSKPSRELEWPGTGRRSGLKPPHLGGRALRRLCGGAGKRWKPSNSKRDSKSPALHGRLNATQPGVLAVSTSVHTWIGGPVQGKRPLPQHLLLFTETLLKRL
jgi:hypothetical protein